MSYYRSANMILDDLREDTASGFCSAYSMPMSAAVQS